MKKIIDKPAAARAFKRSVERIASNPKLGNLKSDRDSSISLLALGARLLEDAPRDPSHIQKLVREFSQSLLKLMPDHTNP